MSFEPKREGEEGFNLLATSFNVEVSRKALAEMVILVKLPFWFIENYGFRKVCNVLQPFEISHLASK